MAQCAQEPLLALQQGTLSYVCDYAALGNSPFESWLLYVSQPFRGSFFLKLTVLLFLVVPPILYFITISLLAAAVTSGGEPETIAFLADVSHVVFHAMRAALAVAFISTTSQISLESQDIPWIINLILAILSIAYNASSILFTFSLLCPPESVPFVEWFYIMVISLYIVQVGAFVEEARDSKSALAHRHLGSNSDPSPILVFSTPRPLIAPSRRHKQVPRLEALTDRPKINLIVINQIDLPFVITNRTRRLCQ
ncbi:MAG: hypothetical protein SGCHY_001714 [Lobulomycetales sp.]